MSDIERPDSGPSAANRSLGEHLRLLRRGAPDLGGTLVPRVVPTARWQRAVRGPVRVAGMIAGAAVDGLLTLFAPGRRR